MKYLGIDVGGTTTKYGIVDENGVILEQSKKNTPFPKEEFLVHLKGIIKEAIDTHGIEVVGMSFPGFIDYENGVAITAGFLTELEEFDFKSYLAKEFDVYFAMDNDVNCFAMAEKWKGNAENVDSFVAITIGTGIGGAIYVNGGLWRGANFAAGEFGFIRANGNCRNVPGFESLSCTCGIRRLRENYASWSGVDVEEVTGEQIFDSSEPYAKRLVYDFYDDVSNLIHMILYSYNPEKILIGGAVSARPDLIDNIKDRLYTMHIDKNLTIVLDKCKFKNDSGIIGAVYNAIVQKG